VFGEKAANEQTSERAPSIVGNLAKQLSERDQCYGVPSQVIITTLYASSIANGSLAQPQPYSPAHRQTRKIIRPLHATNHSLHRAFAACAGVVPLKSPRDDSPILKTRLHTSSALPVDRPNHHHHRSPKRKRILVVAMMCASQTQTW